MFQTLNVQGPIVKETYIARSGDQTSDPGVAYGRSNMVIQAIDATKRWQTFYIDPPSGLNPGGSTS